MIFDCEFNYIVSLGSNCEPAAMLRRTERYQAHVPFDWLVASIESVGEIIRDGGAQLGLEFEIAKAGHSVKCQRYGVLYHHEFPRGEGGAVRYSEPAIRNCRDKLTHKMAQLAAIGAEGLPTLFVRFGPASDLEWDVAHLRGDQTDAGQINRLAAVIAEAYPGLDFRLLVIVVQPQTVTMTEQLDPRIRVAIAPANPEAGWMLAETVWDEIFAGIAYRPLVRPANDELLYGGM